MKKILFFMFLGLCGCTYSITMVHTEGTASDVVDETATNSPSADVRLPLPTLPI